MTKITKIAEINIRGNVIDIEGQVRDKAWVFVKKYNESDTQGLIDKLKEQEYLIKRKLEIRGYFFTDEIGIASVEAEVIRYLISHCFNTDVECRYELGQLVSAIFFDKEYCRHDGRRLDIIAEELYKKHYVIE